MLLCVVGLDPPHPTPDPPTPGSWQTLANPILAIVFCRPILASLFLGQIGVSCFGHFGPIHFWPIHFGPNLCCVCVLCAVFVCCVCCVCCVCGVQVFGGCVQDVGAPSDPPPSHGPPPSPGALLPGPPSAGPPKISLFFPLPPPNYALFHLFGGSSRGILVVFFEAPGP